MSGYQLGVIIDTKQGSAIMFHNKLNLLGELTLTLMAGKKDGQRAHPLAALSAQHGFALIRPSIGRQKLLRAFPLAPRKAQPLRGQRGSVRPLQHTEQDSDEDKNRDLERGGRQEGEE